MAWPASDTEIEEPRAVPAVGEGREKNIFGFDVSVNEAAGVGCRESIENL